MPGYPGWVFPGRLLHLFLVATCVGGLPDRGRAQAVAPSQLTPPTLRPPAQPPSGSVVVPGPPPVQAPAGAENLDVLIDQVVVEGGFSALAQQTRALAAGIEGRRVTIAQVYAFANALEGEYAKAGFVLVRAAVPPQQLLDHGRLRIVVVDGFIASVDVSALPANVRDAVAARLADLVGRRHLVLAEIERHLLIAGDVPGITLRSTLTPDTAEGAAKLVIEGSQRLVTGSIGVDDRLPGSEGTWQLMGSLAVNSPFGFGEQFYTSFGSGADVYRALDGQNPLRIYGGGIVVPLGHDGVTINPEFSHTSTRSLPIPRVVPSVGTYDRLALRLSDPLIRTRTESLTLNAAFDDVQQKAFAPALQQDLSLDRYRAVRVGLDYATGLPWGTDLQTGFNLARGLGGRGQQEADTSGLPLSAVGAAPNFTKFNATLHLTQGLPASLRLDISGQVQSSLGRAMLRAEQLGLSDADSVSGYPTGTFAVDQGETLRAELSRPMIYSLADVSATLAPYLFAAGGRGHLTRATVLEQPVTDAGSLGFGARGTLTRSQQTTTLGFGLEIARQFTDVPGLRQGWRVNFNVMLYF